ncbi:MAG: UvrD-helicase domain-containing protein [Clostridia bacterium]|nr:UvrD-helicase domain-containing protein [Clostridia bacterium]
MQLEQRFLAAKRRLFDTYYGQRLNPEQRAAVFHATGPLLVLAGAGSGKTTVLVNRIVYLIKYGNAYHSTTVPEGVSLGMVEALEAAAELPREEIEGILPEFITEPCPPWQMLAFTFTNKAAAEIRERLTAAFDDTDVSDAVWTGTFHSICLKILRRFGDRLGYRTGFSIYDTEDKKRLISVCMKELHIDEKILAPRTVASHISMAKDRLEDVDDMDTGADPRGRDVQRIYRLYQKKLMEYNAMDFDDILMKTVELLQNDREVLSLYAGKFRYVCVDEYQDTNYAQFVLTELLSGKYRNIMVVGDDDQSIYRFRGATVENILGFDKTFPDATVVKLEQNYRSTETILNAANAIIAHNGDRHKKTLWSERGAGEAIRLHEAQDQTDEGRFIVDEIALGVASGKWHYGDFAVLYRLNELARSLESTFAKRGIPYRVLGSQRFTDRKEIKDILAYLSIIESSDDNQRLKRIINEPKRKIGASTVETVETIGNAYGLSMFTVMERADEYPELAKSAAKLQSFVSIIKDLRSLELLPSALIPEVFERTGYHEMLLAEGFEGEGRIDSVQEFISAAAEYEKRCASASAEPTLMGFLEEMALISDVDKYDDEADAVVLMTVHSAKGLEFPCVFLAGMEDGIFPSEQNLLDEAAMSEERRLAYVAVTRAKEKLYITHAKERMMYGRTMPHPLSCFIREEVPMTLLQRDTPARMRERPSGARPSARPNRERATGGYEALRRPAMLSTDPRSKGAVGAQKYGIERFAIGARVRHSVFGDGTIVSSRDMGGDVLYEVRFDDGQTKKLMASFAKLTKVTS